MTVAGRKLIRDESKEVKDDLDPQCMCSMIDHDSKQEVRCPTRWSVLLKHTEFKSSMYKCSHCNQEACSLCVHDQASFVALHENRCRLISLGRQYLAMQLQNDGQDENEDDNHGAVGEDGGEE